MRGVIVIAEAGVNHNGSTARALELVDAAADAGADIVKFQTFRAAAIVTENAQKADYQKRSTGSDGSQLEMLKALELDFEAHRLIVDRCQKRGVAFLSTAFDFESLELLETLGMNYTKVPSGDITFGPMLMRAARRRKPLFLSTGMATMAEIEDALKIIAFALLRDGSPTSNDEIDELYRSEAGQQALRQIVTVLHCVTDYPCPPQSINLRAMDSIATAFGLPVGYSDHSMGTAIPLAAVARGATVIEKHITIDRSLPGPDHAASLEPSEFKEMVSGIRMVETALGSAIKAPTREEISNRRIARRSLVAARALHADEVVDEGMIASKRPGTGISPMRYWNYVGKRTARSYRENEPLD